MSAIQTIIETYIRFSDERALLALKAHRVRLLATIDESDPFFRNLRHQCMDEISAIEEGLSKFQRPLSTTKQGNLADAVTKPAGVNGVRLWGPTNPPNPVEGELEYALS